MEGGIGGEGGCGWMSADQGAITTSFFRRKSEKSGTFLSSSE